ncbi:trypsin-like peptidase domain-containing protein [uncultured Corynebacterium sp.]|uniref:S1C family serine protease n=1 Tax=uncultured Corynebacterium sp. TaxID=159447 RepID=UPI0028D53EB0|nr:trypsin-like peptidase domain-containing protein [uncultured Corynebacterium sp.]
MTNDPRKSNDSDNQPFGNPQQSGSSGFEWPGSTSASQPQQPPLQGPQLQGSQRPPQQPVAPQQPQQTQQIPRTPTSQSVSDVPSSLGNPNNPYSAAGPMAQPPQAQQVKERRTIGLLPAAALALVAAIAAGSIAGVYATRWASNSDTTSVAESLKEPASRGKPQAEAGTVQAVAEAVQPAVVSIRLLTEDNAVSGSGSIISQDGYVLTNNHVVEGAADGRAEMTVTLQDGSTHRAKFVAGDSNTDVAVIKVEDVSNMPTITIGNSDDLAVGQNVVAIGAPLGLEQTVTTGIVSALNRPVRAGEGGEATIIDAIQTDAAINPGNSGGPLVNMNGELIGMNSVIASTTSSGSEEAGSIGLGFAIPANFARRTADQLIKDGKASYPLIGVSLDQRFRESGAKIAEVSKDGPGDKAGLKKGEVVVAINDRVIKNANGLIAAVRSSDFGAKIKLKVVDEKGENPREVEVTLPNE